ncbi:MAG: YbaY family lipoprotein [Myxacorys chilensis ATA2-1-KO14]|nr:YbaY family lipoprotein [Myxacorys chilensis ATA2-1-KO14]
MNLRTNALTVLIAVTAVLPAYAQQQKAYSFQCSGGKNFQAVFSAEQAIAMLDDGKSLLMRQVLAASGTRYQNAGYTLSTKGNEAFITLNDQMIYQQCSTKINSGSSSNTSSVSGTVSYLQRIALPPNAVVEVQLQDVSRADAPAVTISEQTIPLNGRQVPIPFSLSYDSATIRPTNTYTIAARILIDGKARWRNTSAYRVITQGKPTSVDVIVNQI